MMPEFLNKEVNTDAGYNEIHIGPKLLEMFQSEGNWYKLVWHNTV